MLCKQHDFEEIDMVYRRNKDVVTRHIAGEILLVPVSGELADLKQVFSVESVAATTWELIDGQRSLEDIVTAVMDEYDVDRETALGDVNAFLEELEKSELVTAVT